jgi:hypothetical protein
MMGYFREALPTLSDSELDDLAAEVSEEQSRRNVELLDGAAVSSTVGVVATPGRSWAIPMGGQVGLDTESSASRQHRIDTGEFLRKGEAWSS